MAEEESNGYANKHIPRLIHGKYPSVEDEEGKRAVQVLTNGRELTAAALLSKANPLTLARPILITDRQPKLLGMKLPGGGDRKSPRTNKSRSRTAAKRRKPNNSRGASPGGLSVRDVADKLGMDHDVDLIDVKMQEEVKGWTMRNLVDYFECEERKTQAAAVSPPVVASSPRRKARSAAQQQPTTLRRSRRLLSSPEKKRSLEEEIPIVNQISLEFSRTPLEKEIQSPKFVRDLDWIDNVWPRQLKNKGDYPVVQYYCLTSPAGCYTDFHIDFGGSSVWYHVISGAKVFLLMPPTESNLAAYESWQCRDDQADTFLLDHRQQLHSAESDPSGTVRVNLTAGLTMIIPTGWIHAVYTPADSVVIGGNFLHGLDIAGQLNIFNIEERTGCRQRFSFPHFVRMMFYAGAVYLTRMRSKSGLCEAEWGGMERLVDTLREWSSTRKCSARIVKECASICGCTSMKTMLDEMTALLRGKQKDS